MKKNGFVFGLMLMAAAILINGCQSREKRVVSLIKADVMQMDSDIVDYTPVSTTLDSAFCNVFTDSVCLECATKISEINSLLEQSQEELQADADEMNTWGVGYKSSDASSARYNEAKENVDNSLKKIEQYMNEIHSQCDIISSRKPSLDGHFIGWKVNHSYNSKNQLAESKVFYIIDKDFKRILYRGTAETYNDICGIIKSAEKTSDDISNDTITVE